MFEYILEVRLISFTTVKLFASEPSIWLYTQKLFFTFIKSKMKLEQSKLLMLQAILTLTKVLIF